MLLWIVACVVRDEPPQPHTSDTGTVPTVAPTLAVVDVDVAQDGADLLVTFWTRDPVTRTLEAVIEWPTGSITRVAPFIADGTGEVLAVIPDPCSTYGADADLVVAADGRRFDRSVFIEGTVGGADLTVPEDGTPAAACERDVRLFVTPGIHEVRAAAGLISAFGDDGSGLHSFQGNTVVFLGSPSLHRIEITTGDAVVTLTRQGLTR